MNRDGTGGKATEDAGGHGTGGAGSRGVCNADATFKEADIDRVRVEDADKADIGTIGEAGIALDGGAEGNPIEIEIGNEDGALGIADVKDGAIEIVTADLEFRVQIFF